MSYLELWTSACLRTSLQRALCCWEGWMPCTSAPRLPPNNLEQPQTACDDSLTKRHIELHCLTCNKTKTYPCHCQSSYLTWLEQEDLVILAQFHEPWDALGELHHVLDCMCDLDGTLLPQHVPRLEPNTPSLGLFILCSYIFCYCYDCHCVSKYRLHFHVKGGGGRGD